MSMSRYYIDVIFLIHIFWTRLVVIEAGCPPPDSISPCRCLLKLEEYQVWCSHSDLPQVLSGIRSLSQHINSPIDELILENNYLPSLPGRTFSTLKVLRLMVRQNGLERVSHDWLSGLEGILMELFIVEPKLRYLPDESLGRLNALEAITIQTNDLQRLPQISSLVKLRYLQIESVALAELSPRNFKNLPALENFYISRSKNLQRLEAGQFENLPFLRTVNLSLCGVDWLHPRTFFNLPMIKELSLVGNKIKDAGMVGRSSKDLSSIETIDLDFNHIDKLSEASFVDIPSLQTLKLSFNNIAEIHHGAFHRVPKLRSLYLNNNILRRVHPESFLQPSDSGLEELWMVNNDISHIAELKSLLDALPRLIFLDMSFNKLETMPFGSLRGHPTLEVLKLNHNKLYQIDKETFMAMPALRELGLKNNSLTNYNQEPLWNLPSLKGLDISQNYYRRLEPLFLANLPSLRRLDISGNQLESIDPISFSTNPRIEFVNISNNNLLFIHPATFKHCSNLYELDVSRNQLQEIVFDLPKGLEHLHLQSNRLKMLPFISGFKALIFLRYLDLSDNLIEKLNPYHLKNFPYLKKLYIRRNLIMHIEEGAFESLSKLEILDLTGNKINQLHANSFRNVQNLKELNLGDNNIESILPGLLQKMPKLIKLDINRNRLVDFVQGNLNHSPNIKALNISGNYLTKMPQNIFKMKHMKILDLSHNRIKVLPIGDFSKLEELVNFRMSDNYIKELKIGSFTNMRKLRVLQLDHNDIDNIETNSFQSLPALEMIRLDSNKLPSIPTYSFNNLTMLQLVELQHNLLKTLSNNAFSLVPNLLVLNLSHNHIPSIEDAGLKSTPSLEVLDLSYNVLGRVDEDSFRKMEWLVEIRMDNNNICGIFGAPFSGMPRLRVISLKKNKITRVSENVLDKIRTNLAVFDVDENPLDCNCNALWLQAWAEESSTLGPHCVDGNLLRELKFIPSDCRQKQVEDLNTNCDSDNAPHHTSQVFSKYTSFRNMSNGGKTNSLAPLPQESEYFYDEYVDYPFNESLTTISPEKENILDRFVRVNHSSPIMPQKSSHIISGDTPTMYAATSANKTKPNIPKERPDSPSSSGFTFFGVPLPSLNLNQLLGGSKKSQKSEKSQSIIPIADRKMAIMNKPNIARATTQNSMFRPPPFFPNMETGGFVPMLPGDGGFRPIVDPKLTEKDLIRVEVNTEITVSTQRSIIGIKPVSEDQNRLNIRTKTSSRPADPTKNAELQSFPPQSSTPHYVSSSTISSALRRPTNSTPPFVLTETKDTQTNPTPTISSNTNISDSEVNTLNVEKPIDPTVDYKKDPIKTEHLTETSTEGKGLVKKDLQGKLNTNVTESKPGPSINSSAVSSTPGPDIFTQKPKKGELSLDKIANVNNASVKSETASTLSALLVPGGQQPHTRPAGRPKITKVESPYTSTSNTPSGREQYVKNMKEMGETVTLDPAITKLDEAKENWYFANYNRTYSEPFHAISSGQVSLKMSWSNVIVLSLLLECSLRKSWIFCPAI